MPPLVDPSPPVTPGPAAAMEPTARSKSVDDLERLKQEAGVGASRERVSSTDASRSSKCSAAPMEWVGSYFFDQFVPRSFQHGTNASEEEDLQRRQNVLEIDDDTSVGHFDESDFMPSNWTNAAEYIPPVGFAVVAGGLCFANPIIFLGGILTACTALGAVHAAQTSYDSCIEGNFCAVFDKKDNEKKQDVDGKEVDNEALKRDVSDVTFNLSGMEDAVSDVDPSQMLQMLDDPSLMPEPAIPDDPSCLETTEETMEWVNRYYPPLHCTNIESIELSGLNALEVFDVFLADEAPYTFSEFQKKRQDKNIRYGAWEDLTGVTQPSLVQAAAMLTSQKDEQKTTYHNHLKERILHFDAKTNSGLFGPPYATTTKVQRCLVANKRLLVLESKTTLKNIPFCDRFYVLERWLVTSEKRNEQYVSSLSVSCQVVFTQSCAWESTVVSKSQDTVTEIATQWNEMAQNALKMTEEARQERLQSETAGAIPASSSSHRHDEDQSIEVESLGRTGSRINGDEEIDFPKVSGKPPAIPTGRRIPGVPRSLSRSLSGIMLKRRKSNPL